MAKTDVANRLIWFKGQIMNVNEAMVNVLSPTSQFGLNVFEGIPCYWNDEQKQLYAFRLSDHYDRLIRSAKLIQLDSKYTKEDIFRIVEEEDVAFIRLQFCDIFGVPKNIAIAASQRAVGGADFKRQAQRVPVAVLPECAALQLHIYLLTSICTDQGSVLLVIGLLRIVIGELQPDKCGEGRHFAPFSVVTIAIVVHALHLPFIFCIGRKTSEVGHFRGGIRAQGHPALAAVDTEVIDTQIVLVRAIEVVDGDVAFSSIAAQVGGVFHIRIGGGGLGNQSGSEVRYRSSSGGKEDFKMLFVSITITSQPHPQCALQVKLG